MIDDRSLDQGAMRSQALAIQRSLAGESKEPVGSFKPMRGLAIANQLLAIGALESARLFLADHVIGDIKPVERLRLHLNSMPTLEPRPTQFMDDPESDLQVVSNGEATRRPVLFVFCGHAQRFSVPLNLMHRWFGRLDAHIVYLKDIHRAFFLSGLASLGNDYEASVEHLKLIALRLNASGIGCIGHSGGTFGALNMGIDLGAERVLCLAGPTKLDLSLNQAFDQLSRAGICLNRAQPQEFDLRQKLTARAPEIRVRCIFGALNEQDRREAEHLSGLDNVELCPVENWQFHFLTEQLILNNTFCDHLSWVTAAS